MPATQNQLQAFVAQSRGAKALEQQLVGLLFEGAAPELLEAFSAESLTALGRRARAFIDVRAHPGEVRLRVYNPSLEKDGWSVPYTVLELSLGDRPFIVDSVRAELRRHNVDVLHLLHPILEVHRDADGKLLGFGEGGVPEAYELYFLALEPREEVRRALEEAVAKVLRDVVLATDDYGAMRAQAKALSRYLAALAQAERRLERADELAEYAEFMRWLTQDNYVFLGYREYDLLDPEAPGGDLRLQVTPDSGLGVLRKASSAYTTPVPLSRLPEGLRERVVGGQVLTVTKTNAEATVHRPARMDYIGIKKVVRGAFRGENRFVGLFTSKALSTPVDEIPILRRKLRLVLALDHAKPGSHDFKRIISVFNSIPRDELFWSDPERLHRDIRTVMAMADEGGVRLTVRPDPLARGFAVMVVMPRDRFNAEVRRAIQAYLTSAFRATHVDYQLAIGEDEAQVRFHFFFTTDLDPHTLELAALERRVVELTRTWDDRLSELLEATYGPARGRRLAARYARFFDERYRADTRPETAVHDVAAFEELERTPFVVRFRNPEGPDRAQGGADPTADGVPSDTHLEVYHRERTLVLSEVLPLLENLGFRVLEQVSYFVALAEGPVPVRGLDVFRVQGAQGERLDLAAVGERLQEALTALLTGRAENDRLNRLVLYGGLRVRQVALLRTLQALYAQLSAGTSRRFVTDTLLNHPALARLIYHAFEVKFAPDPARSREAREAALREVRADFNEGLAEVASLAEDGTLQGLFNLVEAAVRTNFFLDKPFISLKLESARVTHMPEPRPLFEIFVSAPTVEGVHLRGGRVARGGLRWSDRPDDVRTEVLGLMKTQMTKNAVIVPVGSKGGFVLKGAPSDPQALRTFVREAYQTYLRGLLDLTDNLVEGQVVHPEGVVLFDDPDPYLVVAADKGTATFSDLANRVAAEYGFWLGDAFASGGSYGYDHKKEGITARGAWECVARHFRELGRDVHRDTFTALGIGDMSGDVFGNGMLYTPKLKLLAAFNHQHIFLDPDPDPEVSYRERQRLFELPRSTWADYDPAAISEGGGVFSRFAKSVPLSKPVQRMLGVEAEALSGQDLIRAILKMPVDLLWNGGVGTYVKASAETHAEAGDSANNAVRVDACELRARVVGEGGNLGFTQRARIEYALAGGRINTDAVDNSAGVDMSDHEVNLKILLQPLVTAGRLSFDERNALLKEMTAEVSALVLRDNYRQSLALSLAQRRASRDVSPFVSLQAYLAERGTLRPEVEALPDAKTALARGLTRPELAVLLAYTKMGLYRRLLETDFPDEPFFAHYLVEYFPKALQARFKKEILSHPLRREITATQFTNTVVDLLGMSFVHRNIRDTGASPVEVVRGALLALEILEAPALLERLFALDGAVVADAQYAMLERFVAAVEGVVAWLLLNDIPVASVGAFVETYKAPLATLRGGLAALLPEGERARYENTLQEIVALGFEPPLAAELASLEYLPSSVGVVDVSRHTATPLETAARLFYALGERFSLGALRDALAALEARSKWDKIALNGLVMDLRRAQLGLTEQLLVEGGGAGDPAAAVEAFLAQHPRLLRRFDAALAEIRREDALGLASGGVLSRLLWQMLEETRRQAAA
jgi:glutamate dehydrogenase